MHKFWGLVVYVARSRDEFQGFVCDADLEEIWTGQG